jgi:hypothetical protein
MVAIVRTLGKTILAGAAAIGIAGACGMAWAGGPAFHTMTVQLPDGGTARIQYTGDVAPKVTFGISPMAADFFAPVAPFGMLDAIEARMDREMNWLFSQSAPMNANQVFDADLRNMPKGMTEYSMVSTMTPNGVCMHRTTIVSTGKGKPKVVSQTSGDCGKAGTSSAVDRSIPSFDSAASDWPKLQSVNYATE